MHVESIPTPSSEPRAALRRALADAAQALPAQGPIGVFVHHNTLRALEHLPFHEAVAHAARELETHGYLSEAELRAAHARGRIEDRDLDAALDEHLRGAPQPVIGPFAYRDLCLLALRYPLPVLTEPELRWQIGERQALLHLRSEIGEEARRSFIARSLEALRDRDRSAIVDAPAASLDEAPEAWALAALWTECLALDTSSHTPPAMCDRVPSERSHRDLLLSVTGVDPAAFVNPWLVRFCGAFLDRGVAEWPMPGRERGMLACFREHIASSALPMPRALDRARGAVQEQGERDAADTVLALLDDLGVDPANHAAYLQRVLLALPGWAGMVRRLEMHPEEHPLAAPSLMEFTAIRLTLDRAACIEVARRELDYQGPLARLPAFIRDRSGSHERPAEHEAAFRLFGLCQLAGLTAADLAAMSRETRRAIIDHLDGFDELTRRRIWQRAYELHYRDEVLQAVGDGRRRRDPNARREVPRWQVAFCFDDREESLRRHLEEVAPEVETLGAAGSFGIAIDYADLGVPEPAPLSPVGVVPAHTVLEVPEPEHETWADAHAARRGALARASRWVERGSRGLVRAALLTPLFGLVAAFPLVVRVLFPRAAEQLRHHTSRVFLPAPPTDLTDRYTGDESSDGKQQGFTPEEHAEHLAATLHGMGLVRDFGRIVLILGHRSISLNNPHASAYDCGACGGRRGGPNARVFARAANRPEVREALRAKGIDIPSGTCFVSGHHNTANDEVVFYDVQDVPASHREELAALKDALDRARVLDAHERCRHFKDVDLDVSPAAALRHVERRAADLSQTRPEYCHAGNAVCIVGRRALTRGLFLDRRAFVVSYDPTIDDDGAILEHLLAAACPVGAGISLEYYFSAVDNDRYGAGTKLPHNVTALLGVMDGHASDLRTGLTWEMVEIHEPMRLLLLVESTPEVLLGIAARQPRVGELVLGEWVQLACIRPDDGAILVFDPVRRTFEPWTPSPATLPEVPSSIAHYGGRRGFVPIVRVREGLEGSSERHDVG